MWGCIALNSGIQAGEHAFFSLYAHLEYLHDGERKPISFGFKRENEKSTLNLLHINL